MENGPTREISDTQNRLLQFHRRVSTKEGKKEHASENLDAVLIDLTNDLSHVRQVQIRTLIDALVDASFNKKTKRLGCEVMGKFKEHRIFELIVDNFIENLPDRDMRADDPDEPAFQTSEARDEIAAFIANYANDPGKTLDEFIENWCRQVYPNVNFYHLFRRNPELKSALCHQMEMAAEAMIMQKYHYLYTNNPRRFILDFLFGRAVDINEQGKTCVDRDCLVKLMRFMISENANPEDIYMILYEQILEQSAVKENVLRTRASVNDVIRDVVCDMDRYPFLHGDFNYDNFFNKYFTPVIRQVKAEKLPNKVRFTDATGVSQKSMSAFIHPSEVQMPLLEKASLFGNSPEEDMFQIRSYFNYLSTPQADLSDEEVKTILGNQLAIAAQQIVFTTGKALSVRGDKAIINDCRFLPELLNCRDVSKLFVWMAKPREFFREPGHEQYKGKVKARIVAHQARKMLELLLMYRKFAFKEGFRNLQKNRVRVEVLLRRLLKIRNEKVVQSRFRMKEVMDDAKGGNGEYICERFEEGQILPEDDGKDFKIVRENGRLVKYYPVEEKQGIECEAFIPGKTGDSGQWIKFWIYSGDGNMVHAKWMEGFFSSILRDKEPSDGLRMMAEENELLRDWLNDNFADNVIIVKDKKEGRDFSMKGRPARKSRRSCEYNDGNSYKKAMYMTMPKKEDDGAVSHDHVQFEVQMDSMERIFTNVLSAYTRLSHSTTYTPEREFDNLFRYFFPPILYGTGMADYRLQGYNYTNGRSDSFLPPNSER